MSSRHPDELPLSQAPCMRPGYWYTNRGRALAAYLRLAGEEHCRRANGAWPHNPYLDMPDPTCARHFIDGVVRHFRSSGQAKRQEAT